MIQNLPGSLAFSTLERALLATITLSALSLLLPGSVLAERIVIPIQDPSRAVELEANFSNGTVTLEGAAIAEVIVEISDAVSGGEIEQVDGRYRIPNTSSQFVAEAEGNKVRLSSPWGGSQDVAVKIQVPIQTSVSIGMVNGEVLTISGVDGEHELKSTNSSITAHHISGSLVASTSNGGIDVSFDRVDPGKAMSFVSFNGNVEVAFPDGVAADIRVQAMNGEILSDFELELVPSQPTIESEEGRFEYKRGKDVMLRLGGGGAEMQFKTWNGNVSLKRTPR